ncbi:MAG: HAMP domain-containing sensor histidine kinase [Polyangiaceae bacterium]
MVARTLEARLSARVLALAVAVLALVGAAGAVVTERTLDGADEARARQEAAGVRDALAVELSEGDPIDQAASEVVASARAQGVRMALWFTDGSGSSAGATDLPRLSPGTCATIEDATGDPWRACCVADARASFVVAVPIAEHRVVVRAVWRATVALVVAAGLLLWWAIRRALRAPLAEELTSLVGWTTRLRRADGAYDEEPPPGARTTEIAHLSKAFGALVGDLLEALARERANSAHIAHELRTPLTAIVAELDALASQEATARAAAMRIRADASRLADVIDAILVLSAGTGSSARGEVVNVADLAREVAPGGVTIEAPDEALAIADERLVRLAVRNLLDNAGKYGGGARVLRVSREGDAAKIAVIDGGAGLDAAERDRMFDRYWRRSASGEGRGLGLALVRAVAERHGGAARAVPGPGGAGLEVSLTLGHVVGWHDLGET